MRERNRKTTIMIDDKRHVSAGLLAAITMGCCHEYVNNAVLGAGPRMSTRLPQGLDLEAEYKLIQQKKSKLSASQRAEVVGRMES